MDDSTLGRLLRDAERSSDADQILHAANGLARAGRHVEAGRAAALAEVLGRDASDLRDALVPELAAFAVSVLRASPARPQLLRLARDADDRLLAVDGKQARFVRLDVATGETTVLARLPDVASINGLAVDARGRIAATLSNGANGTATVHVTELDGGVTRAVPAGNPAVEGVTLAGPDLLVTTSVKGLRAVKLSSVTNTSDAWELPSHGRATVDVSGTIARLRTEAVELHEPFSSGPRASGPFATSASARKHAVLAPAGRERLVVASADLALVGSREVIARTALPLGVRSLRLLRLAASPSGRLVALWYPRSTASQSRAAMLLTRESEGRLDVIDLVRGEVRTFRPRMSRVLGSGRSPVLDAVWSPSGRKLVVSLWDRRIAVLDADAASRTGDGERELEQGSPEPPRSWQTITDEDRKRWGFKP